MRATATRQRAVARRYLQIGNGGWAGADRRAMAIPTEALLPDGVFRIDRPCGPCRMAREDHVKTA